jgi:hypothetical protein
LFQYGNKSTIFDKVIRRLVLSTWLEVIYFTTLTGAALPSFFRNQRGLPSYPASPCHTGPCLAGPYLAMPRLATPCLFRLTHVYDKPPELGPPVTNANLLASYLE